MNNKALQAQPVRESQVPAQIERLKNEISEALDVQETLRARLGPVLRTSPETAELSEALTEAPLTPLADDLLAMACRIRGMTDDYRDILSRLEL